MIYIKNSRQMVEGIMSSLYLQTGTLWTVLVTHSEIQRLVGKVISLAASRCGPKLSMTQFESRMKYKGVITCGRTKDVVIYCLRSQSRKHCQFRSWVELVAVVAIFSPPPLAPGIIGLKIVVGGCEERISIWISLRIDANSGFSQIKT